METNKEFTEERREWLEGGQSTGEYVLPDYLGDVKKILFSRARAVPSGKYKNAGTVDICGVVCYDVVYLDGEDSVTCATFTTDFDLASRCSEDNYIDAHVRTRVANYALRLMGPRKFSAKANLECECFLIERREYVVDGDTFSRESAVANCQLINIATAAYAEGKEREFAEELANIEGAIVDDLAVVISNAECQNITTARCEEGIEVKCDVQVSALLMPALGAPYTVSSTFPYSSFVDGEGIEDDMALFGVVDLLSLTTSINPGEDGISVVASVILQPGVRAVSNTKLRLVKDCYSTDEGTLNEEGEFSYIEHIATKDASEKFSAEVPKSDIGSEDVRNVLFANATPKVEETEIIGNTLVVRGILRFSGIACEVIEDGKLAYSPLKIDTPFSVNVNYDLQIPENAEPRVAVSVTFPRIESDSTTLYPSATIGVHTSIVLSRRESCITASNLTGEVIEHDRSLVRVYYPTAGETLFDVAKKFHTSCEKIGGDNELTESVMAGEGGKGSLVGIKNLIIK